MSFPARHRCLCLRFTIAGVLAPTQGTILNGRVYVFKLGGTAPKPQLALTPMRLPKPPAFTWTEAQYARGGSLFANGCVVCHGFGAIGGGAIADLRYSARLQSGAEWAKVVREGERVKLGMPSFGTLLTADDAELVRAYVVRQATFAYEQKAVSAKE